LRRTTCILVFLTFACQERTNRVINGFLRTEPRAVVSQPTVLTASSAVVTVSTTGPTPPEDETRSNANCLRNETVPVDIRGQLEFAERRCRDGLTPIWTNVSSRHKTATSTLVQTFSSAIPVCLRLVVATGPSPSTVVVSLLDDAERVLSTNRGRRVFFVPSDGNFCISADSTFRVAIELPDGDTEVGFGLFSSGGPADVFPKN
jgi:hypothetical protein